MLKDFYNKFQHVNLGLTHKGPTYYFFNNFNLFKDKKKYILIFLRFLHGDIKPQNILF